MRLRQLLLGATLAATLATGCDSHRPAYPEMLLPEEFMRFSANGMEYWAFDCDGDFMADGIVIRPVLGDFSSWQDRYQREGANCGPDAHYVHPWDERLAENIFRVSNSLAGIANVTAVIKYLEQRGEEE